MSRNLKRMLFAFVVTTACYGGTEYWYRSGQHASHSGDGRAAVAKLNESSNEVQRKEAKRVIWESVGRNDELFTGEAIRTTSKAEAKIILLKSGTIIHLEPDSLVVLEENANGLALDFLQGNLFVQGAGKTGADSNVTLKTGSGEIKLKSADMSLSKDQSGSVNLEVFKGQAELEQNGKKLALAKDKSATLSDKGMAENKDRLLLLSPQAGETILLNLIRGEKLDLTWKPLSADYHVLAEVGPSRANLKSVNDTPGEGQAGKISFAQKPGKWFLRLTAKSDDKNKPQLVSMVIPFTVEPKSPPTLLEPAGDAPLVRESPDQAVEFRWMNRNKMDSQILEVAKDAAFKNSVLKPSSFSGALSEFSSKLEDGHYYWRVTGYMTYKGKQEALSSLPNKLDVMSNLVIKAATLLSPLNKTHISYIDAQKMGVNLKWQIPIGVKRFRATGQRKSAAGFKTVFETEIESGVVKWPDIKPGDYRWKVTSLDPKGHGDKDSESFEFSIDDIPKLEWAQAEPMVEYSFSTPTPSLVGQWKPVASALGYRYRISPIEIAIEESAWQSTKLDKFDVVVKQEGKYLALVEALGAKGQVLAHSDLKTFVVKRKPLLPAPRWAEQTPPTLKTDGKGNLSFGWDPVDGAQQYLMILENAKGEPIEERPLTRNTASVNRLKPGQYKVKLKSVDIYRRPSAASESKKLEVPNTSDIKGPSIKAMKVK